MIKYTIKVLTNGKNTKIDENKWDMEGRYK